MRAAVLGIVCAVACATAPDTDAVDTDVGPPVDPDAFTVVVLPDTQIYAMSYPETFDAQLRWVAEHAEAENIVFVSHVGDIVQTANATAEWEVAVAAYEWLEDAGIPYGFSVGGHDFSVSGVSDRDSSCANFSSVDCDFTDYLTHFGPERFEDRSWWAGHSPSGWSNAQRVNAGGLDLLFVHLPQDPPRAEVDWAHELLDANPGALAHVTTHRHLFDYRLTDNLPSVFSLLPAGRFNPVTYLVGGQDLKFVDSLSAESLFTELIAAHPNIWGVHCGHVDAEFYQVSENDAGLPVYEILNDYQEIAEGGAGWMRLLTFKPNLGEIEVRTWSPTLDRFRENGESFQHSIDIVKAYAGYAVETLSAFGFTQASIDALIESVETPGETRDEYYDALYGEGQRDSHFVLPLDVEAYITAGQNP
ncbi:MAG: metallophosphoesterase [Myxococcota bacterium]